MLSRFAIKSPTITISASIFQNAYKSMPKRNQIAIRHFQKDARAGENAYRTRTERIAERQTLKEKIMTPAGPNGNDWRNQLFLLTKLLKNVCITF